jgi:hypothetical protein
MVVKLNPIIGCSACDWKYLGHMDWQQVTSLAIVAAAAGALLWAKFRRRKFSFDRVAHCSSCASSSSRPQHSVVYRARKGQRPEILVKIR